MKQFMNIFLLLVWTLVCIEAEPFEPRRTHLIQEWNTNQLIRGNYPLWKDDHLALPWIYEKYGNRQTRGIIVICLLNPENQKEDKRDIEHEYQIIQENPSSLYTTEFYNRPIYPEDVSPQHIKNHPQERRILGKYAEDWSRGFRSMRETVKFVRHLMETRNHTIIFVHCEQGTDRTGVVIGSYLLHYTGAQWFPIQRANFHIQNRHLLPQYQSLLDWEAICQEIHHTIQ